VIILDDRGTHTVVTEWDVNSLELTRDGAFVLASGDDAKRAAVWEVRTGRQVFEAVGDLGRRQSLRAGLGVFGDELYVFSYVYSRNISVFRVRDAVECGWMATTGMFWYHVSRMFALDENWLAVHGYHDGEGRDTIVAVRALEALRDPMVLYGALFENPSVREWGYRSAVGPAGPGHAVIFRDPEWEDDDPPDDPTEAFRGLVVWDLDRQQVIQRLDYDGDVEREAPIGADAHRVALMRRDGSIDVVLREDGSVHRVGGMTLDPFRLEVAQVDAKRVSIVRL
jgi:hypothetical protein